VAALFSFGPASSASFGGLILHSPYAEEQFCIIVMRTKDNLLVGDDTQDRSICLSRTLLRGPERAVALAYPVANISRRPLSGFFLSGLAIGGCYGNEDDWAGY
jgi:hypothetical protein